MPLLARTAFALVAGLAALAAHQTPAQDPSAGPRFTFSAGPFERALALIDPAALVHPQQAQGLPPSELPERDSTASWKQWAAALRAAKAAQDAPAERAWLAAFA